jgi:protein SCO1/2
MKFKLVMLIGVAAAGTPLRADPVEKPTSPSCCCSEEKKPGAVSTRSVYQIDATWIDDGNRSVQLNSFRGHPVVVAMFFARCEYACPVLVSDMQRLRAALPDHTREATRFLLVSFDAARDTSAALKAYRERLSLGPEWTLLHGQASAIQDLAMVLGVNYKQDARGQFSHSNLITVLNADGEIVYQHAGLRGDVSETAAAVAASSK